MKNRKWLIPVVILAVIAIGVGCFFAGRETAVAPLRTELEQAQATRDQVKADLEAAKADLEQTKSELEQAAADRDQAKTALEQAQAERDEAQAELLAEQEQAKAEREREILIERSDLEGLGEIDGPIYVTGHKSPDTDTVGCAIAYAALLRELGYDAKPVVLGDVNNETKYVLKQAGVEIPEKLEDASGLNMVLVDHSEYSQSAEGLKDAKVLMIIDHHGDGSVTTGNQMIYDAQPLGATATIVWFRYLDYGVAPTKEIAHVLMGAILSDTKKMQSNTTTAADREALKALSELAGVTDLDAYYRGMFQAAISYEGMPDDKIFLSDYREYEAGGTKFCIGCVEAYDEAAAHELAVRMKAAIETLQPDSGMDLTYAQISIFHDGISVSFIVPANEAAWEVLKEAFGDQGEWDGTDLRLEPGISRRQVLVPAISEVLEAHPKE